MAAPSTTDIFEFDRFHLDRRGLFRRDENAALAPVELGSRALDVLRVLLERPGDLVSRDEIMAAAWPGIVVEDNNLTIQIAALRRVLDQDRANGSSSRQSRAAATALSRRLLESTAVRTRLFRQCSRAATARGHDCRS